MKRKCAYCEKEESLTLEHIWPEGLLRRYNYDLIAYGRRQDKFYKGDMTIRDVCQFCNNSKLSILDDYLCYLYDNCFCDFVNLGDPVKFSYKYDLLLRSLLKISYNSSRAYKENERTIHLHKKLSKYILGVSKIRPANIIVRLQIVTSAKVIFCETNTESIIHPDILRCADIPYDGVASNYFIVRMISIRSYWFYIIIPCGLVTKSRYQEFLTGFKNWRMQPGVLVQQNLSVIEIPVEKTTYMHDELIRGLQYSARKQKHAV